jgi:hypothetical protein
MRPDLHLDGSQDPEVLAREALVTVLEAYEEAL